MFSARVDGGFLFAWVSNNGPAGMIYKPDPELPPVERTVAVGTPSLQQIMDMQASARAELSARTGIAADMLPRSTREVPPETEEDIARAVDGYGSHLEEDARRKAQQGLYMREHRIKRGQLSDEQLQQLAKGPQGPLMVTAEAEANLEQVWLHPSHPGSLLDELHRHLQRVADKHPPYHDLHQAYGKLCEEVAELFDEVRVKEADRSIEKLRKECLDVAGVAMRALYLIDNGGARR